MAVHVVQAIEPVVAGPLPPLREAMWMSGPLRLDESNSKECPTCKGKMSVVTERDESGGTTIRPCETCNGAGRVPTG